METKWTKEQDEILTENYKQYNYQELVDKFFPDKTVPIIRNRIKKLKLPSKIFHWTDEDIKTLIDAYENGMYIKDIRERYFPLLSLDQVRSKASALHLKHKVSCVWKPEMEKTLKENFPYYTNQELVDKFFPNLTVRAIEARGRILGLNKTPIEWSKKENQILITNYNIISQKEICELLPNKTLTAIIKRASELNLTREVNPWTENEISLLKKYYKILGAKKLSEDLLSQRTSAQITGKANYIGLKRHDFREWTVDEIELLKKYYNTYSLDYLVENFFPDRNKNQVKNKQKELGLVVTNKFRDGMVHWTKEQLDLLYNVYPNMNTEEFHRKYFSHISMSAMYTKINKLKIKKTEEFRTGWTQEERDIVKEMYPDTEIPVEEIAKLVNKDIAQVQFCANEVLGIYRRKPLFSEEEKILIRELYPHNKTSDIIDKFPNRTVGQLERYARRMGVLKTKEYIRWVTLAGTKNSLGFSKPQQKINDLLDKLGIKYISEYECKYYLIDQYLEDAHLMIEVQGDYWHCNPTVDCGGKSSNIRKDKAKHTFIKSHYNIEILYLWETDINNNLELCENLILKYVENNGILEDYHSFNYILDNNVLKLIENKHVIGY